MGNSTLKDIKSFSNLHGNNNLKIIKQDYECDKKYWNYFGKAHKMALLQILSKYQLEMLMPIFTVILNGNIDIDIISLRSFINTDLCSINNTQNYFPIYQAWIKEHQKVKITILGPTVAGKTTIVQSWINQQWKNIGYEPTLEESYQKNMTVVKGGNLDVYVTEFGGIEGYRHLWSMGIRDTHILMLVFSDQNTKYIETFNEVLNLRENIYKIEPKKKWPSVIVVKTIMQRSDTNSNDNNNNQHAQSQPLPLNEKDDELAIRFCQEHQFPYIEVDCRNYLNVDFLFEYAIYNHWFHYYSRPSSDTTIIRKKESSNKN